jgi:CDP-6-deoxy-D-xylo-4-hexulose-3-dehydrase
MVPSNKISELLENHIPKYVYNSNSFTPGETPVYYSGPYWDNRETSAAVNSFLNGKWITAGESVHKFEIAFSKKFNVKYSHMVNSGSSANLILISALKKRFSWQDGDEIIVSPVGFPTTVSVIYQNGLTPVFVDIELDTLNFDIDKIEEKITSKTKAIFVSPVLGNPPNMDRLSQICEKHGIHLVGDNCDSLGTKWNGRFLTDYYIAFSNSFYPAHHISTGEGGMVCTNDPELKKLFVSFSWWGRDCHCVGSANLLACGTCGNRFDKWLEQYDGTIDHKYVFTTMGYNLKPLDLQGAIGLIQLEKFEEIEERRKKSKSVLSDIFTKSIPGIRTPTYLPESDVCWFGTPFICDKPDLKNQLVNFLESNKIQTRNYFAGNILIHPAYSFLDDYRKYPNSNLVLDKVFFIGAAPHYTQSVFSYIESVVQKFEYNESFNIG